MTISISPLHTEYHVISLRINQQHRFAVLDNTLTVSQRGQSNSADLLLENYQCADVQFNSCLLQVIVAWTNWLHKYFSKDKAAHKEKHKQKLCKKSPVTVQHLTAMQHSDITRYNGTAYHVLVLCNFIIFTIRTRGKEESCNQYLNGKLFMK